MNNPKTDKIIKLIISLAQGNLEERIELNGIEDELDIVAQELNMLGEELAYSKKHLYEQEMKIRESEERYYSLVENSHELIQSVSPDGRFMFVNKSWQKTIGYNSEEIKSMGVFDVISEESMEHCTQLFQRVINGEHIDNIHVVFKTKNGSKIRTPDLSPKSSCKFSYCS